MARACLLDTKLRVATARGVQGHLLGSMSADERTADGYDFFEAGRSSLVMERTAQDHPAATAPADTGSPAKL